MGSNPTASSMTEKYIVITGNPVDAFDYIGPFETTDDANDYAENRLPHDDYWVTALYPIEN